MPDLEKCSFCSRPKNEVDALIGSRGVFICNDCIDKGQTAISQQRISTKKEEHVPLPKPLQILDALNDYVIGQDFAKKTVAAAVYNHYKRREAKRLGLKLEDDVEIEKSNILVTGPSGCGKTALARTIAKLLRVPFHIGDATKLTQAGYVGDDVDTLLQGLLEKCSWNVDQAQWGIIVIDEIDKIARKSGREGSYGRDVSGEGVQQALLKLVEGGEVTIAKGNGTRLIDPTVQPSLTIDTSNILFICMGSFDGIQDVINRRINKNTSLGFGGKQKTKIEIHDVYKDLSEDDILDFGILPELAGRLPVLTSVLPLTEDELMRILTEPKNALVKQYRALYMMDNIDLQFDEGALRKIASKAKERQTGARALRGIIEKLLLPYHLTAPSDPEIKAIRITEDFVMGTGEPIIVREAVKAPVVSIATA